MSVISTYNNRLDVSADYAVMSERVAARMARLIEEKPGAVVGLSTGTSPLGVYAALVRRHREEGLDFTDVTCFNLDEYYPMQPDSPHSYHEFMAKHLFDHVNCRRWHVPDGRLRDREEVEAVCRQYEERIHSAGGIDFQLLGIGRTGHIGFNEPGSISNSRTRQVSLDPVTRRDAAAEFGGIENVPTHAITMGIGTILEAKEIVLIASGAGKKDIVNRAMTGGVTEMIPASLLRRHPCCTFYLDSEAAQFLSG